MSKLLDRFNQIGATDVATTLPILSGTRADYLALKPHHYRAGNPATISRVLTVRVPGRSATARFLRRAQDDYPVAVLVESMPVLSCYLRDQALDQRYAGLRPKARASLLNAEMRCISRVIVDPRWRGVGLAVRLVRHALATATTRYTEALAVMGRVSPFFTRAGMLAYERPPLPVEQRAVSALHYAGLDPEALATPQSLERQIAQLPDGSKRFIEHELKRWYRSAGGRGVLREPAMGDVLEAARQRLLAQPIYYLQENTHVEP